MNTQPEPLSYINAQIDSLLDPSSSRDTVLITNGSPIPENMPEGLYVGDTKHGVVITKDPSKIDMIAKGNEREIGKALFGFFYEQKPSDKLAVIAKNSAGIPVAELAVPNNGKVINNAMQAAQKLMPFNGTVGLDNKENILKSRIGLLS